MIYKSLRFLGTFDVIIYRFRPSLFDYANFGIQTGAVYKKIGILEHNNDTCVVLTTFDILERANANRNCQQNSCVQIACVPKKRIPHGTACWTAGWGQLGRSKSSVSSTLKQVGVNVLETAYCKTHVKTGGRYYKYQKIQPEEICAGVPDRDGNGLLDGGVDSCGGMYINNFRFPL